MPSPSTPKAIQNEKGRNQRKRERRKKGEREKEGGGGTKKNALIIPDDAASPTHRLYRELRTPLAAQSMPNRIQPFLVLNLGAKT